METLLHDCIVVFMAKSGYQVKAKIIQNAQISRKIKNLWTESVAET